MSRIDERGPKNKKTFLCKRLALAEQTFDLVLLLSARLFEIAFSGAQLLNSVQSGFAHSNNQAQGTCFLP